MKECTAHQALFTAYHDQELAEPERVELEAHLASCPVCAREWRLFTLTLGQVAMLRHSTPPPDLLPGIRAKLARPTLWQRLRDLVAHPDLSLSLPAAAATVVVAMGLGLFVKLGLQPLPPDRQTVTPAPVAAHRQAAIALDPSRLTAVTNGADPALFQVRVAHPPMAHDLAPLQPDIFITVRATSPHDLTVLRHALTAHEIPIQESCPHGFILHLPPADLPLLRKALGDREVQVFPPESVIPGYPHQKEELDVALRLR